MADREEGAAVPSLRQGQNQQQNQEPAGQQHLHINWSNSKPEFLGKPEMMQKHTYYVPVIG